MKIKYGLLIPVAAILLLLLFNAFTNQRQIEDSRFVAFVAQPKKIVLYWKDDNGQIFGSITNLKKWLDDKGADLKFAMNGGMFRPDFSPQGLFIQKGAIITPLDTASGNGNFYLKPNGVFYITKAGKAVICDSKLFRDDTQVTFATQSGPLLVINGQIHPAFKEGSTNVNIRNGVGVLPDGRVVFAISKIPVNFYDFALYFKSMGCNNALYLDGFVSRMYLPQNGLTQTDGIFGVIVAVAEPAH